jgi:hypothetical protein
MNNNKVPGFGRSDKQIADALGMSASDFKKVKKQMVSDMTKPKVPTKPTTKPKVGYGKDGFKPGAKPKPSPTKKGLKIALGGGVTMDSKTGIKTTATPKPKPIPTLSNKEYLRRQKEFLAQQKKAKKK